MLEWFLLETTGAVLWEEQSDSDCTVWSVEGAVQEMPAQESGQQAVGCGWGAAGSSGQTKGRNVLKGS